MKEDLKSILSNLKNTEFKGKFFQILNSVLLFLVMGFLYFDAKPLDESAIQGLKDQIQDLKVENQELKTLIVNDSTQIKLAELEKSLIDKNDEIENEIKQLIEERSNIVNDIRQFNDDQLFQFFTKYDSTNLLQPYIITVE